MSATLDSLPDGACAPITVLHVDDDPALVELTAEFLQRHRENLTVRMATDPPSALEVDIDEVDCIVSDYDMPGMDGVEFLERVRNEYPALPFILFTGKGSEAVASEAISAGVTDYLQKGTGTEQYELLCRQIENAVGRQRAQTNYRELFEKVPVGLTIHDPETGLITDTNQAFAGFLGHVPEELAGTHPGELSPEGSPFTRENATRLIRQAIEDGSQTFEWQDRTKDGDSVWVEVTLRPTTIDGRQRVLAVVQDITDRKEREQRLQRERDRFGAIFEHSNDAIFLLDPENDRIEDANSRAEELLGYSPAELRSSVAISDVHPDHIEEFVSFLDRVREEGAGWTDEFACVTKSGDRREVEISAAAVDHDDRQYLVANVRDVEERVEREAELDRVRELMEFVLEETDAVIWERDPETGGMTTYPSPCPVLDGPIETATDFRDKIHPDDISRVERAVQRAAESGASRRVEFRTAGDVSAQWVETQIRPVTDEDGSVTLLTGLARDITEARRRERELEWRNARLDLAREGARVTDTEPIDLAEFVEACWRDVPTGDATLAVESDRTISADRNQLRQLLGNLLRNAVEHGGEGVTVTVGDLEDRSVFYLENDDPGIPAGECEEVFEAGYTTSPDGTGFGLAIVSQIADSHGWGVRVTESCDGGVRFEITGVDTGSR
ncbi:MAG: PAS domain S-box protein [Haloarculaceae archaeon]